MRSSELDLSKYQSDKIENRYLQHYDPVFQPWVHKEIRLLELGIRKGESLKLWRDYFPRGIITGIDIILPSEFDLSERIHMFEGNQGDVQLLTMVAHEVAPEGFDIIIDDASHIGSLTRISFWHLFDNHLKPYGIFVLEDWGTGYWGDWADGKNYREGESWLDKIWSGLVRRSRYFAKIPIKIPFRNHSYGMVGFVKQLVDEQGAADWTRKSVHRTAQRKSKFENILIKPSLVFIQKAQHVNSR